MNRALHLPGSVLRLRSRGHGLWLISTALTILERFQVPTIRKRLGTLTQSHPADPTPPAVLAVASANLVPLPPVEGFLRSWGFPTA